jgi:tetratricopeptide (TPR) repeat protein
VLLALVAVLVWWPAAIPALPDIPTAHLNPPAAGSIERALNEVRLHPRSGSAWGRLGTLLRSFEFRTEAIQCLAVAARLDPRNPSWPYFHALLLAPVSPAEAIARLERSAALGGSDFPAIRLRLARMLAEAGRRDEAERQLEALLRGQPDFGPALLMQANLAQLRGDYSKSAALAERCKTDPRAARSAWSLLAALKQRLGDTNAAATASRQAAALPPDEGIIEPFEAEAANQRDDPRDLSDRAQRLLKSGKPQEAASIIDQLVQEHPGFAEGWLLDGRRRFLSKDFPQAEKSIRRHLVLDGQSVNGFFQLGMVLLSQARNAEAAESFTRATALKPDFGPAFFNLGLALVRLDRKEEAVAPFREAIRHNADRIDSYLLLSDLLIQLGRPAEAEVLARQAEALSPGDRRVANLWQKLGRNP